LRIIFKPFKESGVIAPFTLSSAHNGETNGHIEGECFCLPTPDETIHLWLRNSNIRFFQKAPLMQRSWSFFTSIYVEPYGFIRLWQVYPVECGAYSTGALAYSTGAKTIPLGLDLLTERPLRNA